MAKTKKKDYHGMAKDDLQRELEGFTKGLFNLRVRKVTDVVENPASFRQHRREIARIKTELRAREIKEQEAVAKKAAPAAKKPVPAASHAQVKK